MWSIVIRGHCVPFVIGTEMPLFETSLYVLTLCILNLSTKAMPYEMEEIIVPGEGMAKQKDLPKELTPLNHYTVEEKLDISLLMAESLADLHGFSDGVV